MEITGNPDGVPVFLLHGTPGSRSGPKPRSSVLYRYGIRLISYDRPGYGGSTPRPGRTVADAAEDIATIARHLGIYRFSVVGRSGGGPHALACAALLPDAVARTAVLVGFAKPDAADLEWFSGMAGSNVRDFAAASHDRLLLVERLKEQAERTRRDPESLLTQLETDMTWPDRRVVRDLAIRRLIAQAYREALRSGPQGWIDDVLALRQDWGFNLSAIGGPVRLWHGEQDNFAPVSHTMWLARQIRTAEVQVQPGAAHFGAVEILPEMLDWLSNW
ncbi:Pimeloyl-ACP methyl ester carboxylesterase [Micromonospora phaseoli]|uniref:Pimeloyl-ACP methyl ester carboxylesterase n=1 Tax=Micromonospora phaseoli TaxID=1144548 RepID=A0A1H6VCP4_9ACTN|nr:alpha/beta hydrolase [Micromonospora phaseoli]PZV93612.1 pimeloyl-ACP methyl ester carboxylesterase [Micromonospora phaseoli]GIJ79834.1 alpha/beta hydrolase [Micromonospora phaseoli]SEJ02353.1 Pimeloyl-ACP methyl ester carboxylesterase [Micromonospora phaseoli]